MVVFELLMLSFLVEEASGLTSSYFNLCYSVTAVCFLILGN